MATRGIERSALAMVNAAYILEDSTENWLSGILAEALPAFDGGLGLVGFTYSLRGSELEYDSDIVTSGATPEGFEELMVQLNASLGPAARETTFRSSPRYQSASALLDGIDGQSFGEREGFAAARAAGSFDCVLGLGCDPDSAGVALFAPQTQHVEVEAAEAARWSNVLAHVLAGLRLRRSLTTPDAAVLEADGRVVHAEGSAQEPAALEALRARARAIDVARGPRGRRDPDAALAAWQGLVEGEWSLIDRFESDGRRYLVARPNAPRAMPRRALTRRERQVLSYVALGYSNKEVAYALGLSRSTVSSHLSAGMRRMGLRDRATLAEIWKPVPD